MKRPVAAMNEAVACDIVRQCGGDFAKIAVLLAEQISVDGRWSANVCKPLLRAYEIARGDLSTWGR